MTRIERAAGKAVARAIAGLAAAARDELPGDIAVSTEPGRLVLTGKRLARRMLDDARLRAIGLRR
ncbi:hypothetical protein ABC347_09020 [Sphingomonas sp. 1P06PA]|uniref:hypothetical protein n=1 Tax=Sphingomonas sp. 1P06PA TaxID=554121 RepID=UPI0039A5828E